MPVYERVLGSQRQKNLKVALGRHRHLKRSYACIFSSIVFTLRDEALNDWTRNKTTVRKPESEKTIARQAE